MKTYHILEQVKKPLSSASKIIYNEKSGDSFHKRNILN